MTTTTTTTPTTKPRPRPDIGARRLTWGAVIAGIGPLVPVLVLWAVGGHGVHLHGGLALVAGVTYPATFGVLGALTARTSPFAVGLLAGEGSAIGSLLGARGSVLGAAVGLGAGLLGGAIVAALVPMRPSKLGDSRVVRLTAVAAGVVFVTPLFWAQWPEDNPAPRSTECSVVNPPTVDRGPGAHLVPIGGCESGTG